MKKSTSTKVSKSKVTATDSGKKNKIAQLRAVATEVGTVGSGSEARISPVTNVSGDLRTTITDLNQITRHLHKIHDHIGGEEVGKQEFSDDSGSIHDKNIKIGSKVDHIKYLIKELNKKLGIE